MLIRGKNVPTLWDDGTEGSIYETTTVWEMYRTEIIGTSILIDELYRTTDVYFSRSRRNDLC